MKAKAVSLLFALCTLSQAQIPSSFFSMPAQLTGSSSSLTLQYPELTLANVDFANFHNVQTIGTLGHPTTFAWGWVETQPNVYDWSLIDPVLQAANAQHVGMILTI